MIMTTIDNMGHLISTLPGGVIIQSTSLETMRSDRGAVTNLAPRYMEDDYRSAVLAPGQLSIRSSDRSAREDAPQHNPLSDFIGSLQRGCAEPWLPFGIQYVANNQ